MENHHLRDLTKCLVKYVRNTIDPNEETGNVFIAEDDNIYMAVYYVMNPTLDGLSDFASDNSTTSDAVLTIETWNTSRVTVMSHLFQNYNTFNGDISRWDVSAVTDMQSMFQNATSFNVDIGSWKVSKVENMDTMFTGATAFNQGIQDWDVSNVKYMKYMFNNARVFKQDIRGWNITFPINSQSDLYDSAVGMFSNATEMVAIYYQYLLDDGTPIPKFFNP